MAYIEEAVQSKVDLIVFPELFIPGYPLGMNFGFSVGKRTEPGREDWKRYYDASIVADEDEFTQLADTAKKYNGRHGDAAFVMASPLSHFASHTPDTTVIIRICVRCNRQKS